MSRSKIFRQNIKNPLTSDREFFLVSVHMLPKDRFASIMYLNLNPFTVQKTIVSLVKKIFSFLMNDYLE